MTDRQSLSKRTRFEVFKRDGFECQYCGAHPPGVLLHVDHIVPVAGGGGNDFDNLVTACDACNLGKGAVSLEVVPQSLAEKAAQVAEREAQLAGYHEVMEAQRNRIEDDAWRVAEALYPGSSERGLSRQYLASIKRFNETLGLHSILDAAEIARARFHTGQKLFRYFCGICWNRIRERDGSST